MKKIMLKRILSVTEGLKHIKSCLFNMKRIFFKVVLFMSMRFEKISNRYREGDRANHC